MAITVLRFDFRNPAFAGTTMTERYAAALDMTEWAEALGAPAVIVSEHHGSPDGYLPSPLVMAGAMAARTSTIRIRVAAIIPSFHDPIRLAEDAAVVDQLSGGRLDLVLTNGYVPEEFAMFGVPVAERVKRTVAAIEFCQRAWKGEPVEHEGRTVRITPAPAQAGGPPIDLGGATEKAARRAARLGVGFMPSNPEVHEVYRQAVIDSGRPDPGAMGGSGTDFIHLAKDPDAAWDQIAPYAMHESTCYAEWIEQAGDSDKGVGFVKFANADECRASGQYRTLTPEQLVEELKAKGPYAVQILHPLMGGIPPELAWSSLRLYETEVLPNL